MKKIRLDTGVEEFHIGGGGVLRFHPGDPNLYARFLEAAKQLPGIQEELAQKADRCGGGEAVIALLQEADGRIKTLLNQVFGGDNDFHKALGGVNLFATAGNGRSVVANLFDALEGILSAGAERFAEHAARAAREEA